MKTSAGECCDLCHYLFNLFDEKVKVGDLILHRRCYGGWLINRFQNIGGTY